MPDRTPVQRRLAAILAGDVAGYSRLMGMDEVGTLSALKAVRRELTDPTIAAHHGRIVKTTGDGILIEYPSVVDALACAVAIQDGMMARNAGVLEDRRIVFRIGVNIGDIIVDEADIHGDGVNVAARLESLAPPGGICISGAAYDQVEGKLDVAFEDMGEQSLKNIARPVRVYRVVPQAIRDATSTSRTSASAQSERPALPLPDKPSLAVLPLQNMSGDPEQEYFADGIAEDIITGLSKLRWFFVIARHSSFTYKDKAVDARQVGRELGVRYVLEGSVRKSGSRVRITAQLIDAETGKHLWAERYDRDLTDIFALQDEITKNVVTAIEPKLLEAEGVRSQQRSPEDLDAWDMLIRANSLFWRLTKDESQAAIAVLKQLVQRHPFYAPAHSMLAFFLLVSRQGGWHMMELQVTQAANLAARALELDDSDPWAHLASGFVAFTRRLTGEAVEEFQRALDLNPNFAAAHGFFGCALAFDARCEQAIEHIEQAIRMSPHDPQNALLNAALAAAHYQAGRYAEAAAFGRKAIQQRFELTNGHRIYVASLAQAGRIDEARAALARLQELHPENSISWIERNVPYTPGPMARFLEGLRKAGLQ